MILPLLDLSNIQTDQTAEGNPPADSRLPIVILNGDQVLARGTWAKVEDGDPKKYLWELNLRVETCDLPAIVHEYIPGLDIESSASLKIPVDFSVPRVRPTKVEITGPKTSRKANDTLSDYLYLSIDKAIPSWKQSSPWAAIRLLHLGNSLAENQKTLQKTQDEKARELVINRHRSPGRFLNAISSAMSTVLLVLIRALEKGHIADVAKAQQLIEAPLPELDKAELKILLNSPHKEVRLQAIKAVGEQKKQIPNNT